VTRGSCLCGAITYHVTAPLGPATACHCIQCRKMTGSFSIAAPVADDALLVKGPVQWFNSSEQARRAFCPTCGSYLFWDERDGKIWISLGSVDGATGTRLENHIFCAYKGDYYDLTDTLVHHRTGWSSEEID